jgi:hypothetical protein
MKSKKEIKNLLLENALTEDGIIDLSGINFGDLTVDFSFIRANKINNDSQQANTIRNDSQQANNYIHNNLQQANNYIHNYLQQADYINNNTQKANYIYNTHNAIIEGKFYEVDTTDNMYTIIKTKRTRNGVTIIEGISMNKSIIWLYKNDLVAYHATTKEVAKEGFKRKLKGFELKQEIIETIKANGYITREQYHELTGACEIGIQAFAERIGKPSENKLTLEELKNVLQSTDYGYNMIMKWLGVEK